MKDASENVPSSEASSALSSAIRDVKNGFADRDDVVVDLREAHRMRLELIAAELAPVFADVPSDMENFDFAISVSSEPYAWFDAVSHVAMGRDRRTFRFVRDPRLGRVVLAESTDMKTVAAQVTRYVAERIVEHQRMMDGSEVEIAAGFAERAGSKMEHALEAAPRSKLLSALLTTLAITAGGAVVGLIFALVLFWDRILTMKITF